ncbi:hypothetical protein L195_g052569 [Trifolium pratense]|uniref:Retrotransposon gag domain-containing protein n=1 Tax=Trifolium pratense TaxID=57577 RepID=A0A2K3K5V5_TRIPR|nr:hypothetical protein L195_g052569 [Trifolium pratense]
MIDSSITMALKKLPKLESCDGTSDPDEHGEHIYIILDYLFAWGAVKCKLFVLTLKGSAIPWFKNLPERSIDSLSYHNS